MDPEAIKIYNRAIELYEKAINPNNIKKLNKIYNDLNVDICPICYDPFIGTKNQILILTCGHAYHYDCITTNKMNCVNRC